MLELLVYSGFFTQEVRETYPYMLTHDDAFLRTGIAAPGTKILVLRHKNADFILTNSLASCGVYVLFFISWGKQHIPYLSTAPS